VIGSLSFLEGFKSDPDLVNLGEHVVVTGGGNTAMDCARAALRVAGVKDVTVVYRRSQKEMPADPEEYRMALDDGVKFVFLANPKSISDGKLSCVKMALGEPDASGRRRPVETDEIFESPCDSLITAIGEHPDTEALKWFGLPVTERGIPVVDPETNETPVEGVYAIGDVLGASTVVKCIASARKAVEATIDKVFEELKDSEITSEESVEIEEEYEEEPEDEGYLQAEERFFKDVQDRKTHLCENCKSYAQCKNASEFAQQEARRCMDCTYYCNKCVDVCPNRANVAIDMRSSENTDDPFQILHLDAFCNECGNCASFCNHQGRPYKDKFTLFSRRDDFDDSTNSGFYVENADVLVRIDGKVIKCSIDGEGNLVGKVPALVKDLIKQVFISYDYLLSRVEE
ncbi:MAG: FAD-dependent oxidoreductase, partial [Spirochaetales bacterium]|nr:FAD-dependent oxidoreductase [Spirochaetales bacterium]